MTRPTFADPVEATTGLKWDEIVGPSRCYEVAMVRHLVALGARIAGLPYREVAAIIGRADHTTAANACNVALALARKDPRAKLFALAVCASVKYGTLDHRGFDGAGKSFTEPAGIAERKDVEGIDPRHRRHILQAASFGVSAETCLRHWPYGAKPSVDAVRAIMEAA